MTRLIMTPAAVVALALGFALGIVPARAGADTTTDTTVADFDAGTPGSCYVAETDDGEVLLPPTVGDEFSIVPLGSTFPWTGGTATVSGGEVTVSGAVTYDPTFQTPGRSLEFVATFPQDPNNLPNGYSFETIGLGASDPPFSDFPLFAVGTVHQDGGPSQGFVNALVWESGTPVVNLNPVDGQPHLYRIDWSATSVTFWVDGVLKYTQGHSTPNSMRPAISDFDGHPLKVDWMRLTPYGSSCTFASRIVDGTAAGTHWNTLTATSATPSGTGVGLQTRTGNTSTPDGSWSAFAPVSGVNIASPPGRYLQYQALLSTSDPDQTAELQQVVLTYTPCTPTGPEVCDGIDNDCNGQIDDGLGSTTCGLGVCQHTVQNCVAGVPQTCDPFAGASAEVCDNLDNDCDGTVDDLGSTTCGVGACQRTVNNCVAGVPQTCTPGTPSAELCDGIDNNCNGQTDEGLGSTTCGVGACERTVNNCVGGVQQACVPGTPSAEVCDGIDNNCNGQTDEGLGSTTCGVGACERTVNNCVAGVPQTCSPGTPTAEVCNGIDDNCNGQTDEGLGSTTCGVGACQRTVNNCVGGQPQTCSPGTPTAEVCNGIDDNCNGSTDEGLGSTTCGVGACQRTVNNCVGGQPQTCAPGTPTTEVCNGIDDNCNGQTDEGLGTTNCGLGVCNHTVNNCVGGQPQTCDPLAGASPEICDGLDNNCNGQTDEGDPGGGVACSTGQQGICAAGTKHCVATQLVCQPNQTATTEVCNGLDDNCNGQVDENTDGQACSTGLFGVCAAGIEHCQGVGGLVCVQTTQASTELCDNHLDDDCNGQTDESGCVCDASHTFTSTTQSKFTKVRLNSKPNKDQVLTKGTFTLPAAGVIDPATQTVQIRITDGSGLFYEGIIPAGNFDASPSGRTFKYSDPNLAHNGIKKALFSIKGDGVTVKYVMKAQELNQPPFTAGTGTATIIVGTRCFKDSSDACALSSSGTTAKCQ